MQIEIPDHGPLDPIPDHWLPEGVTAFESQEIRRHWRNARSALGILATSAAEVANSLYDPDAYLAATTVPARQAFTDATSALAALATLRTAVHHRLAMSADTTATDGDPFVLVRSAAPRRSPAPGAVPLHPGRDADGEVTATEWMVPAPAPSDFERLVGLAADAFVAAAAAEAPLDPLAAEVLRLAAATIADPEPSVLSTRAEILTYLDTLDPDDNPTIDVALDGEVVTLRRSTIERLLALPFGTYAPDTEVRR